MTRIVNAPEGSLLRDLLVQVANEAPEEKPEPVASRMATLMPVRKVG